MNEEINGMEIWTDADGNIWADDEIVCWAGGE
jgi:hypothetical protein